MKRAIIITMGLAMGLYGGRLLTQQPVASPSVPAPEITKVGVVNIAVLYTKCKQAVDLKKQIDDELKPIKEQKQMLDKLILDWQISIQTNPKLTDKEREQGNQVIKECKRRLEDIALKVETEIGPRRQKDVAKLAEYMNKAITQFSAHQRYHLVVAFGKPDIDLAPGVLMQQSNNAIANGLLVPTFFPSSVNITQDLVTWLNH